MFGHGGSCGGWGAHYSHQYSDKPCHPCPGDGQSRYLSRLALYLLVRQTYVIKDMNDSSFEISCKNETVLYMY